jgi:hypothetical protein
MTYTYEMKISDEQNKETREAKNYLIYSLRLNKTGEMHPYSIHRGLYYKQNFIVFFKIIQVFDKMQTLIYKPWHVTGSTEGFLYLKCSPENPKKTYYKVGILDE